MSFRCFLRASCGACDTRVIKCRLGNDLNRITFFCPKCQDRHLLEGLDEADRLGPQDAGLFTKREADRSVDKKSAVSSPGGRIKRECDRKENIVEPKLGALDQWLKTTSTPRSLPTNSTACTAFSGFTSSTPLSTPASVEWSCTACTFVNEMTMTAKTSCAICGTERERGAGTDKDSQLPPPTTTTTTATKGWTCDECTYINEGTASRCDVCSTVRIIPVVDRKRKACALDLEENVSMATTSLSSPSSLNVSNTSDSTPSTATKTTTTKSSPVDEVVKFRGFKFRRTSCEGVGSGFGDSAGRSGVGDTGNRDLVSEVERSGIKNRDRSDAPDPDLNIDADSSPFLDSSAIGEHKVKRGDETMGGGGGGRGSGITKWKLQDETKMERGGWGGVRSGGPTKPHPQSRDKENVLTDFAHLIPSCRHNRICDVRMVKKSEGNRGRLYFSCTIPKNGKCDYFKVSA